MKRCVLITERLVPRMDYSASKRKLEFRVSWKNINGNSKGTKVNTIKYY